MGSKMDEVKIVPFAADFSDAVIELTLQTWAPVFERMRAEVPGFVYDAFYPDGWEVRQAADVGALISAGKHDIWVALAPSGVVGFVGVGLHPEDRMGEIAIVAVAPEFHRRGIGRRLIAFAEDGIRDAGMVMVMVETVGDSGHAPARRAYEAMGYQPWPVARYFKSLRSREAEMD